MRAEARFEKLATIKYCFESLVCGLAVTVVSSQIAQRLFAFEHRCRSNLLRDRPIAGHVGAISASGQSHFHRARGKSVRLRPKECELFQPGMLCRFTVESSYSRTHFASSLARYVTMISAHGRLTFLVFFALPQLREMIRRNVIVPLPGNSWEGKLIARRKLRCSICGCWAAPACEERELLFL
jgi:hypothetical protein